MFYHYFSRNMDGKTSKNFELLYVSLLIIMNYSTSTNVSKYKPLNPDDINGNKEQAYMGIKMQLDL